jgi:acyl-CoA synthetase (NDP forming)
LEGSYFSLLSKYKIPHIKNIVIKSQEDALNAAAVFGYPLVLKLYSEEVLHKTEEGAVILNIKNKEELISAFFYLQKRFEKLSKKEIILQKFIPLKNGIELIIGGFKDPQFGQLIMLGMGGIFVEVYKDVTFRICPITKKDAFSMISELKSFPIIKGVRGKKPINQEKIANMLVKCSKLLEKEDPKEFDLNPVFATDKECFAVDVRILF